jgi:hypothetical protein
MNTFSFIFIFGTECKMPKLTTLVLAIDNKVMLSKPT